MAMAYGSNILLLPNWYRNFDAPKNPLTDLSGLPVRGSYSFFENCPMAVLDVFSVHLSPGIPLCASCVGRRILLFFS